VVIDVPSGRVTARVHRRDGQVTSVDFVNVPSYLVAESIPVSTSRGEVRVAVGFGGACYAQLDATKVGLTVTPDAVHDLITIGREIKWALNDSPYARHPSDDRLSGIYGTILFEDLGTDVDGNLHQRNVTIFADGEVDRSPCGSGTCSRVAVLTATGDLPFGRVLIHDSIVGSRFVARAIEDVVVEDRPAVIPVVTGMAYQTGRHSFTVDPADDLVPGFVLR
jgi:proline racemase